MTNQPLQINDPTLHQPNRPRPRIRVPVLELQIDLLRAEPHERQAHVRLPHPDHKHLPPEFRGVDGCRDGGLDAGAFHSYGGLDVGGEGDEFLGCVLGGGAALDVVGADAGDEGFCELEAAFVDVRDDERFGARGGAAQEGDEADGAGAADEHAVAEADRGALHACERDAEGLEHGAVFEGHGADLVAPDGGVVDVAAEQAVDGRG